jgi:hypothetical protein
VPLCLALPLRASAQDPASASPTNNSAPAAINGSHPVSVICSDASGEEADKRIALKPGQSPSEACPGAKPAFIIFKPLPIVDHLLPPSAQDDGGNH